MLPSPNEDICIDCEDTCIDEKNIRRLIKMTLKLHQILVVVGRKSLDRRNEMQHCMRVIAYALYVRFPFMK